MRNLEFLQERFSSEGRHLVLGDWRRRHRILIKPRASSVSGYVVSPDSWVQMRLEAIKAFDGRTRSGRHSTANDALKPSGYQKCRLTVLLKILDALHQRGDGRFATLREIAQKVVYQNVDIGRAIEWKSSSHRRQTQRLINEAQLLVNGGYRWLLKGRVPPGKTVP